MRVAEGWKDYELIDASSGERLERWGDTILVRPDPQVIWNTDLKDPLWDHADAIYHRSHSGGGEWEYRNSLPKEWTISWNGLTFFVSPYLIIFLIDSIHWFSTVRVNGEVTTS